MGTARGKIGKHDRSRRAKSNRWLHKRGAARAMRRIGKVLEKGGDELTRATNGWSD